MAAGLGKRCTVQIAYAIGVAEPVSLMIDSHHTGIPHDSVVEDAVNSIFDLTPAGIIQFLNLRRPIYAQTAAYGHFGQNLPAFTWERTDQVERLYDCYLSRLT